ncbi:hypothetical protein [Nakamurella endophytica]|uniref:hypothetical protein n=1 Tax=Nakamurella endophytica TaxID=1748367 RepID=UPI001E65802F|nr:hypothetical protein [Nakamurella endophytica]
MPGSAAPAGWDTAAVTGVLRSVPATAATRTEIGLVNAAVLNALDASSTRPLTSTAPSSQGRPPSDSAWTRYALYVPLCAGVVDGLLRPAVGPAARSAPFGSMVTLAWSDPPRPVTTVSVCAGGAVDAARLRARLGSDVEDLDVEGITGYRAEPGWIGVDRSRDEVVVVGSAVPDDVRSRVVGGRTTSGSLADDPDVRAVLEPLADAATLLMGTELVRLGGFPQRGAAAAPAEALAAVVRERGAAYPRPVFAGFGWRPTSGLQGATRFVTVHGSEAEARTAAELLTASWSRLGATEPRRLGGAATTVRGRSVVTEVAGVPPEAFSIRTLTVAQYPGWGPRA